MKNNVEYILYQWLDNVLLKTRKIHKPYNNYGEYVVPQNIDPQADSISIIRRISTPNQINMSVIECRYK